MSAFDELQAVIRRHAAARQAEQQACETVLTGLYQALRTAGGPGMPLNNVMLDMALDPEVRLRPLPLGAFHVGWLRLGVCEVMVRVRWTGTAFHGEFGLGGTFQLTSVSEEALAVLARQLLRELTATYASEDLPGGPDTLN